MSRIESLEIEPALVDALKRGERAAGEQIYRVFSRVVYGLTLRLLNDPHAAAEATQDTFVDVIVKAPELRDDRALPGWIRSIAVNHCLTHLRSPWTNRRVTDFEFEVRDTRLDATRMNGWHDLERALAALPADTRFIVWMHEVEGYTHAELATLLGRTASYSKSRLARGLKCLRDSSRANGGAHDQ